MFCLSASLCVCVCLMGYVFCECELVCVCVCVCVFAWVCVCICLGVCALYQCNLAWVCVFRGRAMHAPLGMCLPRVCLLSFARLVERCAAEPAERCAAVPGLRLRGTAGAATCSSRSSRSCLDRSSRSSRSSRMRVGWVVRRGGGGSSSRSARSGRSISSSRVWRSSMHRCSNMLERRSSPLQSQQHARAELISASVAATCSSGVTLRFRYS